MPRKRMPRDEAEAREWLKQLAKNLRDIQQAKPDEIPLDFDLANWFADAVDAYTLEKPTRRKPRARSMDVALGLKRRPGPPKGAQRSGLQTAIHVHYLLLWGETWKGIADRLQLDVRTLQRIYATHTDGIREHLSGDGFVLLGYDLKDGKPIVNPTEAATVRLIFERFAQMGSAHALSRALGITRKRGQATTLALAQMGVAHALVRALKGEDITGKRGKPIDEGYLYRLLNTPIYVGETVSMYPGKHKAIISRALWNKVHKILSNVTPRRASKTR